MAFETVNKTMTPLQQISCAQIKGVGPNVLAKLNHLGIFSVYDLLLHLPTKYEDRTRLTPFATLQIGQTALVQGKVTMVESVGSRKPQLLCCLNDGQKQLFVRFFHFSYTQGLVEGAELRCFGDVRFGPYGLEMVHPDFVIIRPGVHVPLDTHLAPVYPTTNGLGQRFWRKALLQALTLLNESEERDLLPEDILHAEKLWSWREALTSLHQPKVGSNVTILCSEQHPARQRLIFEELLAHQLSLQYARQAVQAHESQAFVELSSLIDQFKQQLPFSLTGAQQRVCQEILQDLAKPVPMLRLVQGDVGSGKTVVAAHSAMQIIGHGGQVAIMAPTEILAEQHFNSFSRWMEGCPAGQIRVGLLHGKIKTKARRELLEQLANGEINLIVGTHALFQEAVSFKALGLVVIDEQHRFGVHQRLALRDKGIRGKFYPHQLIMTATPIPRTLAMCAYADLDYSVVDELPPGRKPVMTIVVDNQRRDSIIERISSVCQDGRQVYWVCTLIDDSDVLQAQAASKSYEILKNKLPQLNVGLIHGRLTPKEKEAMMAQFKSGEIQLLIATTVIEVGVDVPNASLMVIENAERLGLAQLHQLRGRVGRGSQESHCVLLYQAPLSQTARHRLQTMRESHDGFYIAEQDLQLRGPGEFLGAKQTGDISMRIADLIRDAHFLPHVQRVASVLLTRYPEAAQAIYARWLENSQKYSHV